MADLTHTLLAAANADQNAERALREYEERNLPEYVSALALELATEGKELRARQLAGLCLKNLLVAKDDALQTQKHEAWKNLTPETRRAVKTSLLQALLSNESIVSHTAAQAASEVAAIELPYKEWPELVPTLLENVKTRPDHTKVASLECLGFTCERISLLDNLPPIDEATTDAMLTTIVDGMQKGRSDSINLAAATAMRNSLVFAVKNMNQKAERDAIINNICEATQSQDARVRKVAYECLVEIATQYYSILSEYMESIFRLTMETIRRDEDDVAKQAIEFWSSLCEVEMFIIDDIADCQARGVAPERQCTRYIQAAVEHLGPVLLEALTKQDEDADAEDENYNTSMAAAMCLALVSQTIEDLVVPVVMPFVQQNIQSENWRMREAATMAFSCILDGASAEAVGPVVNQSIPVLLNALSDPNTLVRDTSAYTIGRICDLHVRAIPAETFPTLVNGLMSKLTTESPRVSAQAANAIHNLAAAFADDDAAITSGTNALSQYIPQLFENLLKAADRDDADEHRLRVYAMEAVSVLIQYAAPDVQPILLQLLPMVLQRLSASFTIPAVTNEDRERKEGIQGLLCAMLQVLVQKLTKEEFQPHADAAMTNLLQVLQNKNATSHTEAFSAISAVVDNLEADFEKYMDALQPFLIAGLRNFEAYQVCIVAVGLVGDLCRALEARINPRCPEIMAALADALKDTNLHRTVKPPVLATFGEVCMAIEAAFEPYMQFSLMLLLQASTTQAPADDEDLIEYVNILRESILEAYTGIIQGLKAGNRIDLFSPYVQSVVQFLQQIASDEDRDHYVVSKAVGLIGDMASAMGPHIKDQLNQPFIFQLLQEGQDSGDEQTIETANWAGGILQQVLRGN